MSYEDRYDSRTEKAMREYYLSLDEKDRRRYAAIEAMKLPFGGHQYVAEVLGCCTRTVRRGLEELEHLGERPDHPGTRRPGGGRPKKSISPRR